MDENKYSNLMKNWIALFDETRFSKILNSEDNLLNNAIMLYTTLTAEFQRIEQKLSNKIDDLKLKCNNNVAKSKNNKHNDTTKCPSPVLGEKKNVSDFFTKRKMNYTSCSPKIVKEEKLNQKQILAKFFDDLIAKKEQERIQQNESTKLSPTFSKHQRSSIRKNKNVNRNLLSHHKDLVGQKNELKSSPKTPDFVDVVDCSVIEETPVNNKRKKGKIRDGKSNIKSKLDSFPVTLAETSTSTTQSTSLSIDEILRRVDNSPSKKFKHSANEKTEIYPYSNLAKKNTFEVPKIPDAKEKENSLIGWSCKPCEEFYSTLDLPIAILRKKMEECLSHHKKRHIEETIDGFWDLSMPPTPAHHKLPESSQNSMVFDL